jgi:hypothetical protein
LARGELRITEVSESGSVPDLRLTNSGNRPVLLLDGEELVGAKQNRVLNLTILAPAGKTIEIPVSCVEAGRWSRQSPEFASLGRAHYAAGRAAKASQVTDAMRQRGERRSHQGAVWADIAEKSARLQSRSPTAAMAAMYEDHGAQVEAYVQHLQPDQQQVGAVFAINGTPRGLELFDAAATWRKLVPKLVRSWALDAIDEQQSAPANGASATDAATLITRVIESGTTKHHAVGEGIDLRLTGDGITGAALAAAGRVVHLCAFRVRAETPQRSGDAAGSRMQRASRRSRRSVG